MPAISVGSVEVDVLPNAQGVRRRMQDQLVPAAHSVGDEVGRVIGRYLTSHVASAFVQGVTNGGRQAQAPAARQGQSTGSTFARSLKASLEAGLARLPEIRLRADSSDAERELYQIRAQMQALRDARIGIDVSTETANAAIERLRERLARLSASDADVAVRVDSGAAAAQLAAFQAQVTRLDGQSVDVDVDTHAATANLNALTSAGIALGPAILPVLSVIAAGLGSVAAAGTAAAAGVGAVALVAVPAIKQISTVLQAQKSAQDAATNATYQGAQASSQGASKALQMASAQQALATAERNGARQIAQAQAQVKQAKQSVADAITQAAERTEQAERQVTDAEKALTQAQKDQRQAQLDLTAARRDAERQLEDMNNQLADSELSLRDAQLRVTEARQNLNAVNAAGSKATALERAQAQLQYDEALQNLKEQQTATKRAQADTAAANKAGVKGTDTYKNAQQQLTQAQQNTADKAQALADAQANQTKTATDNARQIADAQQKVADAESNVAVAQQDAADAVASAQRQIASASQSAAGGTDQAAVAQAKYQAELAKLTPEARATMNAYLGLRSAFSGWSKSLQPQVMPLFTRALIALRRTLPTLTPFVLGAASAIGILQDKASTEVKKPFWQGFRKDLQGNVKPAVIGLGVTFGNILKGMAGVIDAFLPHMDSISKTMQRITARFAAWGAGLKGSPQFEQFLSYSADKGPLVAHVLGQIVSAAFDIGKAISPVSGPLLQLLGGTASLLGNIAIYLPELVLGMYGLFVATKLWAVAQWIANGALEAFNLIAEAGPWGWIILGIVAVVAGLIYAYRRFSWFRDAVQAVWNAIKAGALWLWNNALKPVFAYIWEGIQQLGQIAMWLWTNAIKPAWDAISVAARILLTLIVITVFLPIIAVFKQLGGAASVLWSKAIKPVFGWIGALAVWLWRNAIKPQFDAIVGGFKTVGSWAKWLYDKAIKPAWNNIVSAAKWAWDHGIKPIFDSWKLILNGLGSVFKTTVAAINTQWDKIKAVAKAPVQFVVDTVYNKGIVGVWNKVASAFGAPQLKKFSFASGGIMPGYTPGRDVHKFISPTGGQLELSGGESIFRPEFTRAVGGGFVGAMNSIAKSRGAQGVKAALAPLLGGSAPMATDRSLKYAGGGIYPVQRFADGGIFGWIGKAASAVSGAGSDIWNSIKKGASWLSDTLESSARAGVKSVVNPLLKNFPGMDTGFGKLIRNIPNKIIDALFGYSKEADKKGAGGIGGPRIQAALKWAKTQAGKPYQWAGNGNPSWDCSGFMSAIESVIRGEKPHRRWATGAFSGKTAPPGWVYHGNSAFRIGITSAGVGHTAGTLGKTNVESRGGAGVLVGSRARGYKDPLFGSWYGFQPGKYDTGGWLPSGGFGFNGLSQPEAILTPSQWNALHGAAARGTDGASLGDLAVNVWVGNEGIASIARTEVRTAQGELIQVLNAS